MKHVVLMSFLAMSISLSALQTSYWTDYTKAYRDYTEKKTEQNAEKLWTTYKTLIEQPTQIEYGPPKRPGGPRQVIKRETVAPNWVTTANDQMRELENDEFLQRKFYSNNALYEIKTLERENKKLKNTIIDLESEIKQLKQEKAVCEARIESTIISKSEDSKQKAIQTSTTTIKQSPPETSMKK